MQAPDGAQRLFRVVCPLLFVACLVLSGLATGGSWLCYFKALQLGDVSKGAPLDKLSLPLAMLLGVLVLGEPCDPKTVAGGILITAGALLLVL